MLYGFPYLSVSWVSQLQGVTNPFYWFLMTISTSRLKTLSTDIIWQRIYSCQKLVNTSALEPFLFGSLGAIFTILVYTGVPNILFYWRKKDI